MLAPGDRYQQYVVDGVVGQGGSAAVYRAHPAASPDLTVAMKVLDDRRRGPVQLDRLRREFDFAKELSHRHVVTMFDFGPGWLTIEFVGGGRVTKLTDRTDVLVALAQVADALDYAHGRGVVHCDVKPANILLAEPFSVGGVVLVDFGVARSLTERADPHRTHVEVSLPYIAPEVLRGHSPTPPADEYALACTAVELLIGATPFIATTAMGLIDNQLNSPVPRYSREIDWVPNAFDSILAKAMAKDPDMRYGSCAEFVALITRALTPN